MGRKKRNLDKKTCQKLHARKRFKERFGILLSGKEYNEIVRNIINKSWVKKKGKWKHVSPYKFIGRQSNRISVYEGVIKGCKTHIIYDKIRKRIVTFLIPKGVKT